MGMQIDSKAYVERLKEYSISDVEYLIEKSKEDAGKEIRRHAGPLLMVVMNGIDAFGGVVYGFGAVPGVGKRSLMFMECEMGICEAVAKFLYYSVRCGVTHHGIPKARLGYEVWTDDEWRERGASGAFCKDEVEDRICMNVVKLAEEYLRAVKKVKHDGSAIGGLEDELYKGECYFPAAAGCIPICASRTTSTYGESSSSQQIGPRVSLSPDMDDGEPSASPKGSGSISS